jgi:hypothetical protein
VEDWHRWLRQARDRNHRTPVAQLQDVLASLVDLFAECSLLDFIRSDNSGDLTAETVPIGCHDDVRAFYIEPGSPWAICDATARVRKVNRQRRLAGVGCQHPRFGGFSSC